MFYRFSPGDVAAAFVQLVEKDDNNGAVLTVHKSAGMKYRFTKHPSDYRVYKKSARQTEICDLCISEKLF